MNEKKNIKFNFIKNEKSYSIQSNKFYYFDKNSKEVTVLDDDDDNDENCNDIENSDLETNMDTCLNEDPKAKNYFNNERDDIMMDLEVMSLNFEDKMIIDLTSEEFIKQEKDFVEKHYSEKNKKILNLFLNGNKR